MPNAKSGPHLVTGATDLSSWESNRFRRTHLMDSLIHSLILNQPSFVDVKSSATPGGNRTAGPQVRGVADVSQGMVASAADTGIPERDGVIDDTQPRIPTCDYAALRYLV